MEFIDGVNCVNIYSKGRTEIGKALSNMANIPIIGTSKSGETHRFASVEAWWYWFSTGKKYHHLKNLYGFEAKQEGRKYEKVFAVTPEIFREVAIMKLTQNRHLIEPFVFNRLIYVHYYDYGGKKVFPYGDFTASTWNTIRDEVLKGKLKL